MHKMDQTATALRVALQTMKERCIVLQQRLSTVETENQQLRERLEDSTAKTTVPISYSGSAAENLQLRLQINEVIRHKTQLSEHINMISDENRKLWSRLSKMAKEHRTNTRNECGNGEHELEIDTIENTKNGVNVGANQNLIRSKTFTQHSPNPNLRHKIIPYETSEELNNFSLDEISLDDDKAENETEPELGFSYLNVDSSNTIGDGELDFSLENKCIEGLNQISREAMKQQMQLTSALELLKDRLALKTCLDCAQKSQKPEMADKSLETNDSLNEIKFLATNNVKVNESTSPMETAAPTATAATTAAPTATAATTAASTTSTTTTTNFVINKIQNNITSSSISNNGHLNIIEEKITADDANKICPMCGAFFNTRFTFEAFREHVEAHFIDETNNMETSLERNFEFVSHTVGDF